MSIALLAQSSRPFLDLSWVLDHLDLLRDATIEHLYLTGVSMLLGIAISLLLAAISLRFRQLYGFIAGASGILYTIPSLAAFALLWPLLGGVRNKFTIAVVALSTYTILILLRNIVTGIDGVPKELREAATGMGYTPVRRFFEIELPLALPAIIAGIRIATITVIGLVTVTALIGLGGLGALILDGFRRGPLPVEVITGIVSSVLLASVVDLLLLLLERRLTPWLTEAR